MFKILSKACESGNGQARTGALTTPHGVIETPVFMPVGTRAVVKTLCSQELKDLGFSIILGNTYHLCLRPGLDIIKKSGGLHEFMNWPGAILTDSGGYQVFSLGSNVTIESGGVSFRSVYDGSTHYFTPESVIEAQRVFNSDIAMVLDVCSPPNSSRDELIKARSLTKDWALRSKSAWTSIKHDGSLLFGIIQGGTDIDVRLACLDDIIQIGFDGYALGGLSVGEPHRVMLETVESSVSLLPRDKPRYLMGLGNPTSLIKAIALGIDMFDSVLPTRIARNGTIYVNSGRLNIKNAQYADDLSPLDEDCACHACQNYSRAYLRHLFINGEILCLRLLTLHNLYFINSLFSIIRTRINEGTFMSFKEDFLRKFEEEVD